MDLKKFFEENRKVALAFSGGVDSVFLMHMAKLNGAEIKAYFIDSEFQTDDDRKDAKRAAEECSCDLEFIHVNVLSDEKISLNSQDRCYYCKYMLLSAVVEKSRKDGYFTVIDGNNDSDCFDDRPGMRAVEELGVISPLRICGFTKEKIRTQSKELGIFTWDKPSNSCLATRIDSGSKITADKLRTVDRAESALRGMGFSDFRVRHCGDYFLLQLKDMQLSECMYQRNRVLDVLKSEGIDRIYLDLKER